MKNNKKKIISFLTVLVLLFSYISLLIPSNDVYAQDYNQYIVAKSSSSSHSRPSSGSFKSSGSKSYSTKPKTSTVKPDSGGFSTKPNSSSNNSGSSSTVKPDSGSFSTKPNNNTNDSNTNTNKNNTNNDSSTGSYGGGNYRPIFSNRGFYGYSNPFYGMMYGFRRSSWITKLVTIMMIIVIGYIIIDFIRSRRK